MRILSNVLYFFVFLGLIFAAMFLGGVAGVAGSFYLMVKEGAILDNLYLGIGSLLLSLFFVLVLRGQNKKVMRQKHLKQEMANSEANEES